MTAVDRSDCAEREAAEAQTGARFEQTRRALAESIAGLRHDVAGFVATLGGSDAVVGAVKLAVSEMLTNAVTHAFAGLERPGMVTVIAFSEDPGTLCVLVRDDGEGMKPRPDSPGAGLGLPIVAQLTKSVELRERPEGGTEVALRFALDAAA